MRKKKDQPEERIAFVTVRFNYNINHNIEISRLSRDFAAKVV